MEIGLIRKVDIDREMQQSYLDYAMSVIVARALPDARDGLKPVQRRILYAMYDMGLRPDSPYKKSARIVGEVLGKYHPHGDMAVYEAMARLAQDFSVRYPVVDGQGNFGSIDGDPPAAMRYTEARLQPFSIELLAQLDRDTVDFTQNFDESLKEPTVLPAAAPNLLVNGATGIAVGMATNIPPHNLSEVIDASVYLLENWTKIEDIGVSDLMNFVKGPDFPTGGIVLQEDGNEDLAEAYGTGKGRIIVRGRVNFEEMDRGRKRIIITELPYYTNKSSLISKIADLSREGKLEGLTDLRDESDRQGMRIVLEINRNTDANELLRILYSKTQLQSTYSIRLLALVDDQPRFLTLKQALKVYIEHRLEVIRRRSEFDLAKAKQRAHILEGLRIAIANLDEIIDLIRRSRDTETARNNLMRQFKLSQLQAQAILDMPLKRLAALERKKIEDEYKALLKEIDALEALLKSPSKMRKAVMTELLEVKEKYGDQRKTQIVSLKKGEHANDLLTASDVTPEKIVWVGITTDGLIASTTSKDLPRVSGRKAPKYLLKTSSHHTLYVAASDGECAAILVDSLPKMDSFEEGIPINKVLPLSSKQTISAVFSMPLNGKNETESFIVTATKNGLVKKSDIQELPGPSASSFVLCKMNDGDQLVSCCLTDGQSELLLVSANGMGIRFSEDDVRSMGLIAAGVNGIKLKDDDTVIGMVRVSENQELLVVADDGLAWRIDESEFPLQGRYGQGVSICKLKENRLVGLMFGKYTQNGVAHFDQAAGRLLRIDIVNSVKRLRSGQKGIPVSDKDRVTAIVQFEDGLSFWSNDHAHPKKSDPKGSAQLALDI
jgi:DNA gyrase subunit A